MNKPSFLCRPVTSLDLSESRCQKVMYPWPHQMLNLSPLLFSSDLGARCGCVGRWTWCRMAAAYAGRTRTKPGSSYVMNAMRSSTPTACSPPWMMSQREKVGRLGALSFLPSSRISGIDGLCSCGNFHAHSLGQPGHPPSPLYAVGHIK